jgi:hypothetical protein
MFIFFLPLHRQTDEYQPYQNICKKLRNEPFLRCVPEFLDLLKRATKPHGL